MSVSWLCWCRERVSPQPSRAAHPPRLLPRLPWKPLCAVPLLHSGVPGASCGPGSACWWALRTKARGSCGIPSTPACPQGPAGRGFRRPLGRGLQSLLGRTLRPSELRPAPPVPTRGPDSPPAPSALPLLPVMCSSALDPLTSGHPPARGPWPQFGAASSGRPPATCPG